MKRVLLASTAFVIAGQAFATELPGSWTGCYVGGHLGAGWARTHISEPSVTAVPGTNSSFEPASFAPMKSSVGVSTGGGLGGIQAGCDFQFTQNWLVGVGGDFSWMNISEQETDPFFVGKNGGPFHQLDAKTDRLATAAARVGYVWNRWMLYGKGGAAWVHNKYSIQNLQSFGSATLIACGSVASGSCNPTGVETRTGWIVGAGVAWKFADSWSAGIEYDHYDFGTRSVNLSDPSTSAPVPSPISVRQHVDTVKFTLDYHFGWPGPFVTENRSNKRRQI